MKNLSIIVAIVCLLLSSTTSFAEKVVVIPLGKTVNIEASINWLGDWTDKTDYFEGDAIQYQGSSYLCIQEHVSVNPPPSVNWDLMASKGSKGDTGNQGIQGSPGTDGVDGAQGSPGADGADGSPGTDGSQGIQGEKGDPGAQGEKGDVGPAGSGAVQVYDANDQYLGILIGSETYVSVYNTNLKLILDLVKGSGELRSYTEPVFYYESKRCVGQPFARFSVTCDHLAYYSRYNVYISCEFKEVAYTRWSQYQPGINMCYDALDPAELSGVVVHQYTAEELPVTFPVSFPLRYEVAP